MNQIDESKLRGDFANLVVAWEVGFHTFADRRNGFYSFFLIWLTGAMDSDKTAKLLSKIIKKLYKKL